MLILLVLLGKRLEQSAKSKINHGLIDFFSLVPGKVKMCSDQFPQGRFIPANQLTEGAIFLVSEGEIIAGDGIVLSGEATIDESSITGEPKPYAAQVNHPVKSGTKVISGTIKVKAEHVGKDSIFGKMKLIMENSLSGKTRQSVRFEGLLRMFIPTVLGLSILTFIYGMLSGLTSYESIDRAISVMVISCPCALGIAIPLALVAGVSIAGKQGILVKDLEAFEQVVGLNSVVFDKTGTLTTGSLECLEIITLPGLTQNEVLRIAATLEKDSRHYIALAIKNRFKQNALQQVSVTDIEHHENGISGVFKSKQVRLGNRDFMKNASYPDELDHYNPNSAQLISKVYFSMEGSIKAVFYLGDSLRKDVKSLVSDLKAKAMESYLISGDAPGPTGEVALNIGVKGNNAFGEMLPHRKADFVKRLSFNKNKVAMVGDGINDAPAMAESDLAVAVHSGLNPGEGVASITLMKENPCQFLDFLSLADRVNRTVKQNLVFAFFYNLIGIPVAACGLLNPVIAVTAMLFSSLSVTVNTLYLIKTN
jgi:heavy metal translocating P-type ATPase